MKTLLTAVVVLTGCVAEISTPANPIGIDPTTPVPPGRYDPTFLCANPDPVAPATIARLPKLQWVASIQELLSTLSPAQLSAVFAKIEDNLKLLPEDASGDGYSVHDARLSQEHVNAVFDIAATLATDLAASEPLLSSLASVCGAGSTRATLATAGCKDTFVRHYARKALRRPATAAELTDLKTSYDAGLDFFLGRVLLYPQFYYRLDSEGVVVSGTEGVDAVYRLTHDELLAKISFLFWNRPPDAALVQFAATVDLATQDGVEQVLERVLASPHARDGIQLFFREWLQLEKTPSLKGIQSPAFQTLASGDDVDAPGVDHRREMIDEVLALLGHYALTPGGRYEDVLTSPYSFATGPALSKIYGVARWNGDPSRMVSFPSDQPRAGLLTRAAFLAKDSEYTDPVHKGLRVRRRILCDEIPAPDPTVFAQFAKVVVDVTRTTRDDLESVISSQASCAACHPSFTPLGYFTESYDSLGRFRTAETRFVQDSNKASTGAVAGKVPVVTRGVPLLFAGDRGALEDAVQLGAHLANSGKAHQCLTRQYFRYVHGRNEVVGADGCSLEAMRTALTEDGGGLRSMFKRSVLSAAFQSRRIQ